MNGDELSQILKELRAEQVAIRNDVLGFEKRKNEVKVETSKKLKISWISVLLAFVIQAITVTWFLSDLSSKVTNNYIELKDRANAIKAVDRIELRLQWLDKTLDRLRQRVTTLEKTK